MSNQWLRTKVVQTVNPPLIGWWWFWDDHRKVGPVDAVLHRMSMKRLLDSAPKETDA